MSPASKQRALIFHGIECHFEMIGGVIEHFKQNYDLYLIMPPKIINSKQVQSWLKMYKKRTVLPKMIEDSEELLTLNPAVCIIHTDDDKWAGSVYTHFFPYTPMIIIRHGLFPCRTNAEIHENTHILTLQGVPEPNKSAHKFWSGMWRGISIDEKMSKMRLRPLICVLGDIINEEPLFLTNMMNRITNFKDIDVFIANRIKPKQEIDLYERLSNVIMLTDCETDFMYDILSQAHYVYFFANSRGTSTSSAAFPISYSMLCRMISCSRCKSQYDISSPLFYDMNEKFEVKPLTRNDLELINQEREKWIDNTQTIVRNCLELSV